MTLAAIWRSGERGTHGHDLWAASDSRISDAYGKLIDEGVKLFELPVRCARPDDDGHFSDVFYASSFGLVCAGSTLIFQHVYATLVPLLNNLTSVSEAPPSIQDVAGLAGWVTETLVASLAQRKGPEALRVEMALIGWCPVRQQIDGYSLIPRTTCGAFDGVEPVQLDLSDGHIVLLGDQLRTAGRLMTELDSSGARDAPVGTAPLRVIRQMIEDEAHPTIGGELQIGSTLGPEFRRMGTIVPTPNEPGERTIRLNGLDLFPRMTVGSCMTGIPIHGGAATAAWPPPD